ncbi:MAG: hypothetical protein N4J56_000030 [Chroococcidiopsis sp. SAG 2025]|uniref:hypothetical protein n=1 Tax=Chroococcidiopsis sp. SAG 2025 TaxID=171389 RepID=UPI002937050D|nr:hypothetical protein [Chroococcidiopsis sp. SAG 2025]MDV2990376.1 hypothetical protein [Chroococcidiopsis sp. SAG 2025]
MEIIQLLLVRLLCWQNVFSFFKNVFPEVTAAALITVVSTDNFNFPLNFLLSLSSATLLRLVWNGAIFIHGLGHAIAIATLDRQPNVLCLVNILEHRSIAATLRSLLPFQPIFIPGCDRVDLWVAAGDLTPWRIRIKALGGVYFNLLAIAILWQLSADSFGSIWTRDRQAIALISTFFSQTFLGANLLIILSSWSDLAALVTGVAEIFCCGNFGFLGQRNADDDPRQLLPERVVNIFHEMGRETEIRGEQAGGRMIVATNRDKQTVFVGKKVVNKKRDNLTKSLETAFAAERRRVALAGILLANSWEKKSYAIWGLSSINRE